MDASGDIAIRLFIILALLGLSAFFSSSETALMTVNKIRIRNLAEGGNKNASYVMKLSERQPQMLSAILIGNNVVNLSASSLMTLLVTDLLGSRFAGVATGVLTLLVLIFGEITPKTMATLEAERMSLRCGRIIYSLMVVFTPIIILVNWLSGGVLRMLKVDPDKQNDVMTEEELRTIVEVGHEKGVIETGEKEMINNVFDLDVSMVKHIMVPRIDVVFADVEAGFDELIATFREEHYTRLPVYEDNTDNVVGIINMKDLLLVEDRANFHVRDYMREPTYTYESKKISDLLLELRKTSSNMVVVLDEYGATAGIATLEDILEEIVGEIRDEYDEDEEEEFTEEAPGEYVADGAMSIDDLNDRLGLELVSEDYDSVGGFMIEKLEHLPVQGESLEWEGIRFVADEVDRNRINKVRIFLPQGA